MKTGYSLMLAGLIFAGILTSCNPKTSSEEQPIRIGVAAFSHETCTFCPQPTGIEAFEFYGPPLQGDEVLNAGSYIRGFVDRAREYSGVKPVGIYAPRGARGGSSGSWITREAFDKYTKGITDGLSQAGRLDGVFLSLHGAMAVTGIPKPEAEMVRRIRRATGDIPIFVTLDLHANEDHELSDVADAVFITKRYPHYDARLQGERAARILIRTIRGSYDPAMATRKPGVITPSVFQGTGVSPAMEIMERARRWENREVDVYVSVAFGFAYADVPDAGATVMVVTNNDQELANRIADDMSDYIWRVRADFAGKTLPKTREGVAMAVAAAARGETPVVIADHADRTGNSTHILEELIMQKSSNFVIATIADEEAIIRIQDQGTEGSRISVDVGGYADLYAGNPVHIDGIVEYLGPYAQFDVVAVLQFGSNNRIILTPALHQVTDTNIFQLLGIDFEEVKIVSLKSRVHFRRGYHETGIAGTIIEIDAPGLGPADLSMLGYENIPKDLYPVYRKE